MAGERHSSGPKRIHTCIYTTMSSPISSSCALQVLHYTSIIIIIIITPVSSSPVQPTYPRRLQLPDDTRPREKAGSDFRGLAKNNHTVDFFGLCHPPWNFWCPVILDPSTPVRGSDRTHRWGQPSHPGPPRTDQEEARPN